MTVNIREIETNEEIPCDFMKEILTFLEINSYWIE